MTSVASHDVHGVPPSPLLHEWQRLTREGLAASQAHRLMHALAWYERALQVARQLLAHADADMPDDDRLAAFVVAHLNLADCHTDMNHPACAAVCLSGAHRQLVALMRSEAEPVALRLAACRHLRQTFAALHQHRATHGEHPAIAKTLRECDADGPLPGTLLH